MMQDRLPMLKLLQAEPLQATTHLTFQEYYTARAICRGRQLDELPWRWSPWWANVLRLGSELGDQFGLGLLPRGERQLCLDAVLTLLRARDSPLTSVDVSG